MSKLRMYVFVLIELFVSIVFIVLYVCEVIILKLNCFFLNLLKNI